MGQIHFEGYQVSNVCMALVKDDCLIPTKDAPELGYIKESSNEQYVPDVFFKVSKNARWKGTDDTIHEETDNFPLFEMPLVVN